MLTHQKVSTVDDGSDATEVQPSDWNADHKFTGGAQGAIIYRDTLSVPTGASWLAPGTSGSFLRSAGAAAPTWSTLTIPNTATAGDVLYASSSNTIAGLAIGSAGQLLRSTGTLPAWSTLTIPNTVTSGDVLYASSSNTVAGLGIGSAGKLLRSSGSLPAWSTATYPDTVSSGDVVYASGANTVAGLAIGSAGKILRSTGSLPAWSTTTWPNSATTGDILIATGSNAFGSLAAVASGQVLVSAGTSTAPAWSASPSLTSIVLTGNLNVADIVSTGANGVKVANTAFFFWNTFSAIKSPADGVICLTNNAVTDFARLQFGGTTSSFPSLKRNAAALEVKLADDSAYGQINALLHNTTSGGSTTISSGTGTVKMSSTNSANNTAWIPLGYAGTTYYVPGWTTNAP